MNANAPALVFEDVTKRFGKTVALDGVGWSLAHGEVLGLVGRNGAGKTTALRLAHGFYRSDGGNVRTLGLDPETAGHEVRKRVSLLSEEDALYPWMTGRELLKFSSAIHETWDDALEARLIEALDLDTAKKIATLSRGNRAKLSLVIAVAPRPELLLLDDPTAGLDPLVRREVLEQILGTVQAEGGAVVYASHLIHDLERVADRIAFVDGGRLRFDESLDALKDSVVRIEAVYDDDPPADLPLDEIWERRVDGRLLTLTARGERQALQAALGRTGAREIHVHAIPLEEILVDRLRREPDPKEANGV